nr:uncharacterized protein LOC107379508 [Nothobranchius furzeri]XP_054597073.1 uncharacterized protein LOC107379508 [Nothobranchius furzeri]
MVRIKQMVFFPPLLQHGGTPPCTNVSFYLPLSLLPPAQESISAGSISWHEYSLPAESLVGESRRLRLRRRQWRGREGRGRRQEQGKRSPSKGMGRRGWSSAAPDWTAIWTYVFLSVCLSSCLSVCPPVLCGNPRSLIHSTRLPSRIAAICHYRLAATFEASERTRYYSHITSPPPHTLPSSLLPPSLPPTLHLPRFHYRCKRDEVRRKESKDQEQLSYLDHYHLDAGTSSCSLQAVRPL